MNDAKVIYEEKIKSEKRIFTSVISLLPLSLTVVVSITNFIILVQQNWGLRAYFTLAGIVLVCWSIVFFLLWLILTHIIISQNKTIKYKNCYSTWISVFSSFISLILLIVEYILYDNWYHKAVAYSRPYTLYSTSYALNSLVLIIFCVNIFTTIWCIKK